MGKLETWLQQERVRRGWNPVELAARCGLGSPLKGARRVCAYEQAGVIGEELLGKVLAALELPPETADALRREDGEAARRDAEERAGIRAEQERALGPHLTFRAIPGVFARQFPPEGVADRYQLIAWARGLSERLDTVVWLHLSPGETLSFRSGRPASAGPHWMEVKGRRIGEVLFE